ncbi:MAG: hypothetical protein R3C25_07120 [Hyphomonadaceae bacterium]
MNRLVLALLAGLAFSSAARAQQPAEDCGAYTQTDPEHAVYTPLPGYSVLLSRPPFRPPVEPLTGIVCGRTSIYLGMNDHHVITDLGVPLFIRNAGRVAVLESADGAFRVRFVQGAPLAGEVEAMRPVLDRANSDAVTRATP